MVSNKVKMKTQHFGTAGVRGVFGQTVSTKDFMRIVMSTIRLGGKRFIFGHDSRKASVLIAKTVSILPLALGLDSFFLGMVPTPVVAFSTRNLNADNGFSVTASHNPPRFAGIKIFNSQGMEIPKETEKEIEKGIFANPDLSHDSAGHLKQYDSISEYSKAILNFLTKPNSSIKVLIDCCNGPGSYVTPMLLKMLGHRVNTVNGQTSWRFPARDPEPTRSNLNDFLKIVRYVRPDIAFAHDGDADRIVMVDKNGMLLSHAISSKLVLECIERSTGNIILAENVSNEVEEAALSRGFKVERAKIGKTFASLGTEGVLAIEPNKFVLKEWGPWEDGIFIAALVSNLVAKDKTIVDKARSSTTWHYNELGFDGLIDLDLAKQIVTSRLERFGISEIRELDGIKIILEDGSWFMVRRSGTEPKTRVYFETKRKELMKIFQNTFIALRRLSDEQRSDIIRS